MEAHDCIYGTQIKEIHDLLVGTTTRPGLSVTLARVNERLDDTEVTLDMFKHTVYGGNGDGVGLCERMRIVERIYGAGWKVAYTLSGALGMGLLAAVAAYLKGWV